MSNLIPFYEDNLPFIAKFNWQSNHARVVTQILIERQDELCENVLLLV